MSLYKLLWPFIRFIQPEKAHKIAIDFLNWGLVSPKPYKNSDLAIKSFGLVFKNPVGMAAGFDKNGECIVPLTACGFGFVEVGTITPRPQEGNPQPRLFRLEKDKAIINRMGFNNQGMAEALSNIRSARASKIDIPVGINIGRNKDTEDEIKDYVTLLDCFYDVADYITVNISSPNTPGLIGLHNNNQLESLLSAITEKRKERSQKTNILRPILVKLSPDINMDWLPNIITVIQKYEIDGVIVCNTTTKRDDLKSLNKNEQGGLSGKPLFETSNEMIKQVYMLSGGQLPIIGVGGIFTGKDAYKKIRGGTRLVQIYTSIIYQGFSNIYKINKELSELMAKDGFSNLEEIIGIDSRKIG
jgi:dihydroorotate dehydrogenase